MIGAKDRYVAGNDKKETGKFFVGCVLLHGWRRICNPGGKDALRWSGTELHEPGSGWQMLSADFLYLPDDEF